MQGSVIQSLGPKTVTAMAHAAACAPPSEELVRPSPLQGRSLGQALTFKRCPSSAPQAQDAEVHRIGLCLTDRYSVLWHPE